MDVLYDRCTARLAFKGEFQMEGQQGPLSVCIQYLAINTQHFTTAA